MDQDQGDHTFSPKRVRGESVAGDSRRRHSPDRWRYQRSDRQQNGFSAISRSGRSSSKKVTRWRLKEAPEGYLKDISTLIFALFVLADIYLFGVFLRSLFTYCDQPLQWWCLGAVLLSTPLSLLLEAIGRHTTFQIGLNRQLFCLTVAIVWLGIGTYWVNTCHLCPVTSPLMWWTVFVTATASWCSIIGIIVVIIAFTILSTLHPEACLKPCR